MFLFIRSSLLLILPLAVMVGMLAGCGQQNPLDIPQIKDMSEGVKDVKAEVRAIRSRMGELENDVQETVSLTDDLKNQVASAGKPSADSVKEINALKIEIGSLKTEMDKMRSELSGAKSKAVAAAASAGEPRSGDGGAKSTASGKGKEPKDSREVREVKATAGAPVAAKAMGEFYVLKKGDTLESVAAARKISVEKLREANHIPAGKSPADGARIYIPAP